ncbi:helix-turn-helix transcriptional regulator [Flavobacterium sp. MMLR14_040]|uniref:helix-turn-helix domain-containing protein n=1 Tax=Flavobacterium sp. MMLR14_040 TaxID=3093843 RepID=UPI0029900F62|nr:helix-turn-helix transcriptional regulator [Flavobacterium sp. MMLR14_040]MDW8848932.1 helix-turn-helix transcriptional regulator [Flavobacterium sp. MMLR14_040]
MKKQETTHRKIDSLHDFHRALGLPKPLHPMISMINLDDVNVLPDALPEMMVLNYYKIAYKTNMASQVRYGQNHYDFSEGGLIFTAPNQLFESPDETKKSGYVLLIHPDFLLSYPLARKIKDYGYFSYSANEALHLSDREKTTILSIFGIILEELESRIDDFSQDVIISQLELLLNYCNRFYKRQFITRKAVNNSLLEKLEDILEDYFKNQRTATEGIPTVHYIAGLLHLSPSYLSDMLRLLTGQNAQQHIHTKMIQKAKELLSGTDLTISEIAYQLGFEHPQSFSKLFKTKTKLSPVDFRHSFN